MNRGSIDSVELISLFGCCAFLNNVAAKLLVILAVKVFVVIFTSFFSQSSQVCFRYKNFPIPILITLQTDNNKLCSVLKLP